MTYIPTEWSHIEMGWPRPVGQTHVVIAADAYETWMADWREERRRLILENQMLRSGLIPAKEEVE